MAGFTIEATTTSPNELVELPFVPGYIYDCWVYYGDGSPAVHVTAWDDANAKHVYATVDSYAIEITGSCTAWSVDNAHSSRLQWTRIIYQGDYADFDGWQYLSGGWYGCSNMTSVGSGKILSDGLVYINNIFQYSGVQSIPSGLFDDCIEALYASRMFNGCGDLSGDIPDGLLAPLVSAEVFNFCFASCPNLRITPYVFYDDGDQSTRFLNLSPNFRSIFNGTGTNLTDNVVPNLWACDYGAGTPLHVDWVDGHSAGTLTNWKNIPIAWDGITVPDPVIGSVSNDYITDGQTITLDTTDSLPLQYDGKVELCNNSNYLLSTIIEEQVVSGWSDNSVIINVVKGALDNGPLYLFLTTSRDQRNTIGFLVYLNMPVINNIDPSSQMNGYQLKIYGDFLDNSIVEVGDNSDYGSCTELYTQHIDYNLSNEIGFTLDNGGTFNATYYVFVTTSAGTSDSYPITVSAPTDQLEISGVHVGFGQNTFGRNQFGGIASEIEPRFVDSTPDDNETGVSVLFVAATTDIYCFSSRIQDVTIQISEDGGAFVDAYVNGSFVSPYNGSDSYVDFHQADPQRTIIKVEKDSPWDENITVVVRVTATDEFGNEVTKEAPVLWD
jgi:hypothetical protein